MNRIGSERATELAYRSAESKKKLDALLNTFKAEFNEYWDLKK